MSKTVAVYSIIAALSQGLVTEVMRAPRGRLEVI